MTARGFCTCKRDHPGNVLCHPAPGAAWHYLCDKPVLPPKISEDDPTAPRVIEPRSAETGASAGGGPPGDGLPTPAPAFVPTGTGWPS